MSNTVAPLRSRASLRNTFTSFENGGEKLGHGSGGMELLRAA